MTAVIAAPSFIKRGRELAGIVTSYRDHVTHPLYPTTDTACVASPPHSPHAQHTQDVETMFVNP